MADFQNPEVVFRWAGSQRFIDVPPSHLQYAKLLFTVPLKTPQAYSPIIRRVQIEIKQVLNKEEEGLDTTWRAIRLSTVVGSSMLDLTAHPVTQNYVAAYKNMQALLLSRISNTTTTIIFQVSRYKQSDVEVGAAIRQILDADNSYMKQYMRRFSKDLHENKHVARAALRRDPRWLPDSPASVKNDLDSVLVALSRDNYDEFGGHLFEHASPKLRATKSAVIAAVEIQPYSLFYASKELQADVDVNIAAVRADRFDVYKRFPDKFGALFDNKDVVLAAVSCTAHTDRLRWVSKQLRDDQDVVLAAVKAHGLSLQHASLRMRNNLEVVLAAVTNDGLALQYANKRLKNIKDVAMAAVKSDGRAIQFVCCKLHKDQEVLEAALYEARNSQRCCERLFATRQTR